ncbi:hypothetical protein DEO72_LG8g1597 [Vigna unguiculata]|uniref:Uncharacterized protein n=1 Tax=Vigna unguiculata TaxID=3917 RepID=A0A4D6MSH2_VIGUN|nr:hypothetical protein DEO72_LG8g1596 [Vigna unguiculata]QCE03572.1 hypothetical protein DEO72_LG8g1597 [Vigna unguiculata]
MPQPQPPPRLRPSPHPRRPSPHRASHHLLAPHRRPANLRQHLCANVFSVALSPFIIALPPPFELMPELHYSTVEASKIRSSQRKRRRTRTFPIAPPPSYSSHCHCRCTLPFTSCNQLLEPATPAPPSTTAASS